MKIGYIKDTYPEKRCIINKIRGGYEYTYHGRQFFCVRLLALIKRKFTGVTDWDTACYYKPILQPKVEILHTFNHICRVNCDQVITFETALPRNNFTVHRNGRTEPDEITKEQLKLLEKDNCLALIAISKVAYNIQADMIKDIAPDVYDRLMAKTKVIYPPQDVLVTEQMIHDKFSNESQTLEFILVGGAFFLKGGAQIVDSLRDIRKQNKNFHLTIVSTLQYGDHASHTTIQDYEKYKEIIDNEDWITWYKKLENSKVLELMKKCHIGLLPTLDDTFGYSVLEMEASGCAVVTTNVRAMPEINNSDCGWICNLTKSGVSGRAVLNTDEDIFDRKNELRSELDRVFKEIFCMQLSEIEVKALNARMRICKEHSPDKYSTELQNIYMKKER